MKRKSSSDDAFSSEEENGFIGLGASKKSSHGGLGFQSRMGTRTDKDDVQFAGFEKYSKGIGSKLLQKMGYKKGQGLGVDGSGINVPIDVKLRPSKMGLGHGGFEELPESQQNKDSDNEEKKSWKKPFKRRKKTFQSAKELVLEIEETPLPATISHQSRIIDMTGPQVKILTDITESAKLPQASERFPELVHNLTVLSNLAKQELIHLTNKSRIQVELEKQRKKDLEESVSQLVSSQKTHSKLEKLYSILISCKAKALEKSWDLNNPDKGLQTINEILKNDMNDLNQIPTNQNENIVFKYNVDVFYVNMITPVFKKCFLMKWKLAKDPLFGIEYIMDWKKYFMHKKDDGTMCAFENLLHTVWLPPVRSFVK
jgi:tuftelin-interacting protein 11